jgi:hypothetical protein
MLHKYFPSPVSTAQVSLFPQFMASSLSPAIFHLGINRFGNIFLSTTVPDFTLPTSIPSHKYFHFPLANPGLNSPSAKKSRNLGYCHSILQFFFQQQISDFHLLQPKIQKSQIPSSFFLHQSNPSMLLCPTCSPETVDRRPIYLHPSQNRVEARPCFGWKILGCRDSRRNHCPLHNHRLGDVWVAAGDRKICPEEKFVPSDLHPSFRLLFLAAGQGMIFWATAQFAVRSSPLAPFLQPNTESPASWDHGCCSESIFLILFGPPLPKPLPLFPHPNIFTPKSYTARNSASSPWVSESLLVSIMPTNLLGLYLAFFLLLNQSMWKRLDFNDGGGFSGLALSYCG